MNIISQIKLPESWIKLIRYSRNIVKIITVFYLILIMGCASLTIQVKDGENKTPIGNVDVSVKTESMRFPVTYSSDASGVIAYPEIKALPVWVNLEKDGEYFSIDTTISVGSLKEPVVIYMIELQTIVTGQVIDDSTFKGIEGAIVSSEPSTMESVTDSEGYYSLKSKLFLNAKYDLLAEHDNYEFNQINNIPITVNAKNPIEPIELKKRVIKSGPDVNDDLPGIDPSGGDDEIWIDE